MLNEMTSIAPYVAHLAIYPVKSLDAVDCDRVTILESGALKGDRTWAIFDCKGGFVNGKRNQKIYALRSQFDQSNNQLSLRIEHTTEIVRFNIISEQDLICDWLENYFGFPVTIQQNLDLGYPDDTASPGATIVSTATLEAIASWYPELDTANIRRRFRANIEIAGVPAFWEDRLFSTAEQTLKFNIGHVEFGGVNPCRRCIVIVRDPDTGQPYPKFQKTFIEQRKKTLPQWAEQSRFNHFFRLAVNTRLAPTEAGKVISIGDQVTVG